MFWAVYIGSLEAMRHFIQILYCVICVYLDQRINFLNTIYLYYLVIFTYYLFITYTTIIYINTPISCVLY